MRSSHASVTVKLKLPFPSGVLKLCTCTWWLVDHCWKKKAAGILSSSRQSSMLVMMVTFVVRPFQSCMLHGKNERLSVVDGWFNQRPRFPDIWAQYLTWYNTCQSMSKLEKHCQPMSFFLYTLHPSKGLRAGELPFMSTSCFSN